MDGFHSGRDRPAGHVRPVRVLLQHGVGAEELALDMVEEVLPVPAVARPVHQPARLVGRVVEVVYADVQRHAPRYGLILVRAYIPVQRDDQPVPGRLRPVLVGAVDRAGVADGQLDFVPEVRHRGVHVEREHAAELHRLGVALPALQDAADEAADVLDGVLLILSHTQVFRLRLLRPGGLAESFAEEFCPGDLFVLPLFIESAPADRYPVGLVFQGSPPPLCYGDCLVLI